MLSLNASPFHLDKQLEREELLAERVAEGEIPVIYVNQVGGQDELVFDGGSCVMDAGGMVCQRAPAFVEGLYPVDLQLQEGGWTPRRTHCAELPELEASVYQALVGTS